MWVPVSPHLSGELLGPFLAAKTILPQHPLTAEGVALTACPVLEESCSLVPEGRRRKEPSEGCGP